MAPTCHALLKVEAGDKIKPNPCFNQQASFEHLLLKLVYVLARKLMQTPPTVFHLIQNEGQSPFWDLEGLA